MKESLLNILRCPECKGELELAVEKKNKEIEEGTLHCSKCAIDYPIKDGIPNMITPKHR